MSSPGVWDKLGEVMASLPVHFYIEAVLVLFIIYIVWVKEPYNPVRLFFWVSSAVSCCLVCVVCCHVVYLEIGIRRGCARPVVTVVRV